MGIFDKYSKKVTDTMNMVQKKTSDTIAVKKLEMQTKTMQGEIDTLCQAIGKRVYAAHVSGNAPELEDLFEGIDALNKRIAEAQVEMDKLNSIRRCENCGEALNEGVRFCSRCGTPVKEPEAAEEAPVEEEEKEKCPQCGAERNGEGRFCDMCGHDFEAEVPSEEPAEEDAGE